MKHGIDFELSEVCSIDAPLVDPTTDTNSILPHVNGANIESESGRLLAVRTAKEDGMTSPKFLFKKGDVLYSKLRPNLRKVAIAPFDGLCSADMYPLTPVTDLVTPEYLCFLLLSDKFTEFAVEHSARARMPKLNRASLFSFKHRFPPLSRQRELINFASQFHEIEAAKAASESRVTVAEQLESSLFRVAFENTVPISIGPASGNPPDGWSWKQLADLARLESGHTPSRRHPEWWGGEIPWLALPDIRELDGKVALATKEMTNELGIANSSARVLPKDTVALSRTASVGFVTIFGREMATSQDFVNWICGDELLPRFLMHALRASRDYLVANASGAVHKTLYMPAVKDFHLCMPDKHTQQRIVDQLDEALAARESLLAAARIEREAIEALPAAILRDVFSDAA